MTKVLEFADSSAISKIAIDYNSNQVGVAFTSSPENFYYYECNDVEDFEENLNVVIDNQDSVGRFLSLARKDGSLTSV
jgi:hypothetical protein